MVVRLVLEQKQPVLVAPVVADGHFNRAGIDFLGLVQLLQLTCGTQIFSRQRGDVHQIAGLCTSQSAPGFLVGIPRRRKARILKLHPVNGREEGRMPAMIRPVCVDHAYFGNGRVALFRAEIVTAEPDIVQIHCQPARRDKVSQRGIFHVAEAGQGFHIGGQSATHSERDGLILRRLARLHGVDDVFLHGGNVLRRQTARQDVHACGADNGTFAARHQLDALCRGIRPLIKLTR